MGLYDRDYYREDPRSNWSADSRRGTIAIIVLTLAGMVGYVVSTQITETGFDSWLGQHAEFHIPSVQQWELWRFFTSFFVSPFSFFSIIFGMLLLYSFGGELESLYGTRRFLVFYAMAGILANVAKLLLAFVGLGGEDARTLGPAAPLFATMVLFAFHFPYRQIRIYFFLPISIWLLVVLYLGFYLLMFSVPDARGFNRAWMAEPLVGAIVGFAFFKSRGLLFDVPDFVASLFEKRGSSMRSRPNLRVVPPEEASERPTRELPVVSNRPPPAPADEQLEAQLDTVLAKVARTGKGSLSPQEHEVLQRASEIFKKRRG